MLAFSKSCSATILTRASSHRPASASVKQRARQLPEARVLKALTRSGHGSVFLATLMLGALAWTNTASATTAVGQPFQTGVDAECNAGGIGNGSCEALFPLVPAGFRLEVRHVSCLFRSNGVGEMFAQTSRIAKNGSVLASLQFLRGDIQQDGATRTFTISQEVFMVVPQNQRLRIRFSSFDGGGVTADDRGCFVSGYLVQP